MALSLICTLYVDYQELEPMKIMDYAQLDMKFGQGYFIRSEMINAVHQHTAISECVTE